MPEPAIFVLRSLYWLNFERKLRSVAAPGKFDIYHETGFVPARVPDIPVVYTLYDLSLRRYAHAHPKERVWFFEFFLKRRLPLAGHVLTISEYIRQEAIEELRVPAHRITAVPLAPDPGFHPRPHDQISEVLSRLGIPGNYLLFTGTLEPRKNIDLLVQALARTKHDIPLVLAGWSGWGDKAWQDFISGHGLENRIIRPGYVDEEDLACLYSGADIFIYPSLYEGFGLPVLEAMACACPVITTNASCLPETAGNAALLTDPHDPDQLAHGIDRILENNELRQEMKQAGLGRAGKFTWEKTARATLELFSRVSRKS